MNAITDHIYAGKMTLTQLAKGKFWLYLIPSIGITLFFFLITSLFSTIFNFVNHAGNIPLIGSYLETGVESTKSFFAYLGDIMYQFLILTILSPIYCILSEKIDNNLTNSNFHGGLTRIITDFLRAIFIVIIAIFFNLIFMLIWWFFAWITTFHLLDQIMYFLIGAFFIGFSFYDYSLERYEIGIFDSWHFGFKKIPHILITGSLFCLIFKVPFFGVILAPFLITIMSTIVFLKIKKKNSISELNTKNSSINQNE